MRANEKVKEPKVKKKPGRTPTSCAECRRLKLRCDKNVPCEKCVSRGCAEICPTGVLTSTKGNRMILAGTEELHERISQLQGRIKELEGGLKTLQAGVSNEPHPLLDNDTLRLPYLHTQSQTGSSTASGDSSSSKSSAVSLHSPTIPRSSAAAMKMEEDDKPTIDAFGTLTIDANGAATYMGKTARSEFLMRAPLKQDPDPPSSSHTTFSISERLMASPAFPDLDARATPQLKEEVYKRLPPLSEAIRLCEVYLDHGNWIYAAVTRTELLDEILMTIYQKQSFEAFQAHHALALLFSVFALATHFDPRREPCSSESIEYYQLARTTLGFASPVKQTTLAAIQTLIHMSQFLDFTDCESTSAWIYIGHAVRFAFSIGLHLNGVRWSLPPSEIDRRSRVFWQLFSLDTWTSFYFGRPPSIAPSFVDCEYPQDADGASQDISFHSWSYKFTSLVNNAMAAGMGPRQPTYSTILELDCQIRDFAVPERWRSVNEEYNGRPLEMDAHIYRWLVLSQKETILLNLHRAYFAQALQESPRDLNRHRYLPSVAASFRASWRLVYGLDMAWDHAPNLLSRIHLPWSQVLSAAIVVCLLITKVPSCHWSDCGIKVLETIYALYHKASSTSKSAASLLPSIQTLLQKAREALSPSLHHGAGYPQAPISQAELDRLGGKTHFFSGAQDPARMSTDSASASSPRSPSTSITLSETHDTTMHALPTISLTSFDQSLHPVLVEDLKDFSKKRTPPTVQTLYDSPSTPETKTPTGVPMRVSSTPPLSSPDSSESVGASALPSFEVRRQALPSPPRPPPPPPETRRSQPRFVTPLPLDDTLEDDAPSPDITPTYQTSYHRPPPSDRYAQSQSRQLYVNGHYPSTSSSSSSSTYPSQPSSSRHTPSHTVPASYAPPATRRSPPLAGYTAEFQHYYDSRPSMLSGLGLSPTVGSQGGGFVSGFDPGTIILDGTWQGFIEQLGF